MCTSAYRFGDKSRDIPNVINNYDFIEKWLKIFIRYVLFVNDI